MKTQGIRDKSDHDVAVVHTHPRSDETVDGEVFSGGINPQNKKLEIGDGTVPSIPGVSSIYVATPNGNILKYDGSATEEVRGYEKGKWSVPENQKIGTVTDDSGSKVTVDSNMQ
ncbi:MAG: DUF4329 domain-containing protein [Christensenellaceae bacterium]|nr:DUF4329 domain-containing protein [Christensenellaceae bacterium]